MQLTKSKWIWKSFHISRPVLYTTKMRFQNWFFFLLKRFKNSKQILLEEGSVCVQLTKWLMNLNYYFRPLNIFATQNLNMKMRWAKFRIEFFFFIKTGIKILERGYYHRIRKGFVHWFAFKYRHVLDRAPYGLHSFQADFRTTTTQKLDTNLIPNITNYYVFYFQIILCSCTIW